MWKRIAKEVAIIPTIGKYPDWKPQLAVEGYHQCLYCTISESSFGGIRNFHVEHHRPKGLPQFAHLEQDYSNLYYACAICNTFKSDDWPNEPDDTLSISCYPDPSKIDYSILFRVDDLNGLIIAKNLTGEYLKNKLYLNRAQLIIERRTRSVAVEYDEITLTLRAQKEILFYMIEQGNIEAILLLKKLDEQIGIVESIFHLKDTTIPYSSNQTKKIPK